MKVFLTYPINRPESLSMPDLGLGYLASALRKEQIDVKLSFETISSSEFAKALIEYKSDIVGIKVLVTGIRKAQQTIKIIRDVHPDAIIVIGGPHITADSKDVLNYISSDYAIQGDAEYSLPDFVKRIRDKSDVTSVKGLIYRNNDNIIINEPEIIQNLNEIEFPAWDLMPPDRHSTYNISRRFPVAYMVTSRGCDGVCEFCFGKYRPLRHRSFENIVKEVNLLYYEYGVREIHFRDDNFASNKENIKQLAHYIIDNKMELSWASPDGIRLTSIDSDTLSLLSRAGFYRTAVGIESANLSTLKKVNKGTTPELIEKQLELFNKHNVEVYGTFIIGFPWETYSDMVKTFKFALKLPLDAFVPNSFTPYPGTKSFIELKTAGKLKHEEYYKLDHYSYNNYFSKYHPYVIKLIVRYFLVRFYLRPSFMIRTIKRINLRYAISILRMFKLLYIDSIKEEKF